jgi:hypothetical protein
MKNSMTTLKPIIASIFILMAMSASAQEEHTAYLHALADLRGARWLIVQRTDNSQPPQEQTDAVHAIELTVSGIIRASIDDGKYYKDHPELPNIDIVEFDGRMLRAMELLRKAHADINHEDDDSFAKSLKDNSLAHIDDAVKSLQKLMVNTRKDVAGRL